MRKFSEAGISIITCLVAAVLLSSVTIYAAWLQDPASPTSSTRKDYPWRSTISSNSPVSFTNTLGVRVHLTKFEFNAGVTNDTVFQLTQQLYSGATTQTMNVVYQALTAPATDVNPSILWNTDSDGYPMETNDIFNFTTTSTNTGMLHFEIQR